MDIVRYVAVSVSYNQMYFSCRMCSLQQMQIRKFFLQKKQFVWRKNKLICDGYKSARTETRTSVTDTTGASGS